MRISPDPSTFGGRDSRRTMCDLVQQELGRIFDRDDPLAIRQKRREHVEEGRFTGARSAADDAVEPRLHCRLEELHHRRRHGADLNQVFGRQTSFTEAPNRHRRAVDRDRLDDRIDARAVRESRVDHGRRFVDATPERRDDALDDEPQLVCVGKVLCGGLDDAASLDVNRLGPVDHDLGDFFVLHEVFERPQAQRFVDDLLTQPGELFGRAVEPVLRNQVGGEFHDLLAQLGKLRRVGMCAAR